MSAKKSPPTSSQRPRPLDHRRRIEQHAAHRGIALQQARQQPAVAAADVDHPLRGREVVRREHGVDDHRGDLAHRLAEVRTVHRVSIQVVVERLADRALEGRGSAVHAGQQMIPGRLVIFGTLHQRPRAQSMRRVAAQTLAHRGQRKLTGRGAGHQADAGQRIQQPVQRSRFGPDGDGQGSDAARHLVHRICQLQLGSHGDDARHAMPEQQLSQGQRRRKLTRRLPGSAWQTLSIRMVDRHRDSLLFEPRHDRPRWPRTGEAGLATTRSTRQAAPADPDP
jgi:hypothetical protein